MSQEDVSTKRMIREQLFEACQLEMRASLAELQAERGDLDRRETELRLQEQAFQQDVTGLGLRSLLTSSSHVLQALEADLRASQALTIAAQVENAHLRHDLAQADVRQRDLQAALKQQEQGNLLLRQELTNLVSTAAEAQGARREANQAAHQLERARGLLNLYKRQLFEAREKVRIMLQAGEPMPGHTPVLPMPEFLPSSAELRSRRRLGWMLSAVAMLLLAVWVQTAQGADILGTLTSTASRVIVANPVAASALSKPRLKTANQETSTRVR